MKSQELRLIDAAALMRLESSADEAAVDSVREEAAAGLKHRSAGRRSNRAYGEKFQRKVLGLALWQKNTSLGPR